MPTMSGGQGLCLGEQIQVDPRLMRQEFRTTDAADARRFFGTAYRPGWQVNGLAAGLQVFHRRSHAGPIMLDEVGLSGDVGCVVNPDDGIVVIRPRRGSLRCAGDEEGSDAHRPVLAARGLPSVLFLDDATFDVISIDSSLLRAVAAELRTPLPDEIRFLDRRPRSPADAETFSGTLDYAIAILENVDSARRPLIVTNTARLVTASVLECFSSTLDKPRAAISEPADGYALNRAVAFIHGRAMDDIGINDIAASVHLTPRAVQYLFRRQLDTTPTEYLRGVRLHRAHQDLIAADRARTTVGAIAAKWGFAHTGRFAVLYRQTYGQSPHTTLRE